MSASKEFLARQTKLSPASEEWSSIEYSLQLAIGSTTPVVKQIYSVASPHLTLGFDKKAQGKLVLDSWLDTSVLIEENRIEDVCTRGFKCPQGGLLFAVGAAKTSAPLSYGCTYEFLLVKLGVGRAYNVNVESIDEKNRLQIPPNYDSVYLFYPQEEESSYQHNYVIYDPAQSLPCFIVHFELDPSRESAYSAPLCDICQESSASVYCEADDASLCHDCDEEHHTRGNRLMQRHKRIPISDKPKKFGSCPTHFDTPVDYFCTVCKVPVCINCKMVGSHSTSETATHTFSRILDAYHRALAEAKESDPLMEQRKTALTTLLGRIDSRIAEIKRNADDVEAKIYKVLQEVLSQLHDETQRKVQALNSAELEVKRQLEEMAWVECFLGYQQEVLSPSLFMLAWGRHLRYRQSLLVNTEVAELNTVLPDIRLEGQLSVTTEGVTKLQISTESLTSSASSPVPRPMSSKFRSQLFNRYQGASPSNRLSSSLNTLMQSKQGEALTLKLQKMLIEERKKKDSDAEI